MNTKKIGCLVLAVLIVLSQVSYFSPFSPVAYAQGQGLTVALSDDADNMNDGKIKVSSVTGGANGDLYYILALSEGTPPSEGVNISSFTAAQPLTLDTEFSETVTPNHWLRVYEADASNGNIIGYTSVNIVQSNIGNIMFSDNTFAEYGPNKQQIFGEATWTDYIFELDVLRTTGADAIELLTRHSSASDYYKTVLLSDSGWMQCGMNGKEDGGWWTDGAAAANSTTSPVQCRYRITAKGSNVKTFSVETKLLTEGNYEIVSAPDSHSGTLSDKPAGKVGFTIKNSKAKIGNVIVRSIGEAESGRINVTGVSFDKAEPAAGEILSAIPDQTDALLKYEWSYDDPFRGTVILGNSSSLDTTGLAGVPVNLTVVGVGTHKGTASASIVIGGAGSGGSTSLSVELSDDADSLKDGSIKVGKIEGGESGANYYYVAALTEGQPPERGTNINSINEAAAFSVDAEIEGAFTENHWLRVYETDAAGIITGYGTVKIDWNEIGNLLYKDEGSHTVSNTGSATFFGDASWTNYTYEVDVTSGTNADAWLAFRGTTAGSYFGFILLGGSPGNVQATSPEESKYEWAFWNQAIGDAVSSNAPLRYRVVAKGSSLKDTELQVKDGDNFISLGKATNFTSTVSKPNGKAGYRVTGNGGGTAVFSNIVVRNIRENISAGKTELTGVAINNTSPKVGDVLTAALTPASATAEYEWSYDDPAAGTIVVSRSSTYKVAGNLAGYPITLAVAGIDDYTGTATSAPTNNVESTGTIYYIDSANGDDANPGTFALPKKTLNIISSDSIQPGDTFLLKAGGIWNGQSIKPAVSGSAGLPIIVDMYGEGSKPVINGALAQSWVVEMKNISYWEFRNLDISNWDGIAMGSNTDAVYNSKKSGNEGQLVGGFSIKADGGVEYPHIYILDCYIHNIDSNRRHEDFGGIVAFAEGVNTRYSDIKINGNKFEKVYRMGIQFAYNWDNEWYNNTEITEGNEPFSYNIEVKNNYMDQIGGDFIELCHSRDSVVANNTCYRSLDELPTKSLSGDSDKLFSAGIWAWTSRDITFQNNEVAYIRNGGKGDRTAFDFDCNGSGYHVYQYNYTHHNAGGQLLHMNGLAEVNTHNRPDYVPNTKIMRYNISAFEPLECNQSQNTMLSFAYNNVYYKSIYTSAGAQKVTGSSYLFAGEGYDIIPQGQANNKMFANYIFNNIFYDCERVTYNTAAFFANGGKNSVNHTVFTNNLIYNTPVYADSTQISDAQLTAAGNFVGDPKFIGTIDPKKANGFAATLGMQVSVESPAVGKGISIDDMLEKIKTDMARANGAQPSRTPLDYNKINLEMLTGSGKPTTDFFGNPLSATPDIGVGKVQASSTTYYFDSVGGNDTNPGTSIDAPKKSLSYISSTDVKPGDRFLLKAGSIWNGVSVTPKKNGVNGAPVIVDMYGDGPKPVINGGLAATFVVSMRNTAYWEFHNLEITNWNGVSMNSGTTQKYGGFSSYADGGKEYSHIYIKDCYIHNIDSDRTNEGHGGIIFYAGGKGTKHSDIQITGNKFEKVYRMGIQLAYNGDLEWGKNPNRVDGEEEFSYNILVKNNYFDQIGGDFIQISHGRDVIVESNTAYRGCDELPRTGDGKLYSAGIWAWTSRDVLFQFNEVAFIRNGGKGDRTAFDYDADGSGTQTYQYNYTHHNAGGQMLHMNGLHQPVTHALPGYKPNTKINRYNISAFEPVECGASNETKLSFVYNNIYYKSVYTSQGAQSLTDTNYLYPGEGYDIYPEGSDVNKMFANYIFNNIFYDCERITYSTKNSFRADQSQAFRVRHTVFTNNLIYNTPIYAEDNLLTAEQLVAAGNIIGDPLFKGTLDPMNAKGFDATRVLQVTAESPAVGTGIRIEDMLVKIKSDMDIANANAPAGYVAMDFSEINQSMLTGEGKPTNDFWGTQLSSFADIGPGKVPGAGEAVGDKTALQQLYSDHTIDTQGDYSNKSWQAFVTAMDEARVILENASATQSMVNAAYGKLLSAITNRGYENAGDYVRLSLTSEFNKVKNVWQIKATLKNNSLTEAFSGTVSLREPAGYTKTASVNYPAIAAGGTEVLYFEVSPANLSDELLPAIIFDYTTICDSGAIKKGTGTAEIIVGYLSALKSNTAVTIDGVLGDDVWQSAEELNFDRGIYSEVDPLLSAKAWLAWDSDYLYYALIVNNESHIQPNTNGDIWNGDSIQVAIGSTVGSQELGFALTDSNDVVKWCWTNTNGATGNVGTNANAAIVRDENAKTTTYEIAVKWSYLGLDGASLAHGDIFDASIAVNDDNGGGRRTIEYFRGIVGSKGIDLGRLVLLSEPIVAVTGVTITPAALNLEVGETSMLTAVVEPGNATDKGVTYASSNPAVADVDEFGKVTAYSSGSARITVSTSDGGKTAFCDVTVTSSTPEPDDDDKIAVTGVTITPAALSLEVGETSRLTATVEPGNATDKGVTYASSNPAVADVDEFGKVMAYSSGSARITVSTSDGGKTAFCDVTVTSSTPTIDDGGNKTVVEDKPRIIVHGIGLSYGQDGNGMVSITASKEQVLAVLENVEDGIVTIDLTGKEGVTGADFHCDSSWFGENVSVIKVVFDGYSATITKDAFAEMVKKYGDGLEFVLKVGSISLDVLQNNKSLEWYSFSNPVLLSLPDENGGVFTVMRSKDSKQIIPRSWYAEDAVYAKVYSSGVYEKLDVRDYYFKDTTGRWMENAVEYLAARGVTSGVGDEKFAPERGATRAEFITMLMRTLNLKADSIYSDRFADVSEDSYYYNAVHKARVLGIVGGVGDNRFNPNTIISRQDMFTILHRAMLAMNMLNAENDINNRVDFTDWGLVSSYARTPITELIEHELVSGKKSGNVKILDPTGTATRAEVAQVLYNLLTYDSVN